MSKIEAVDALIVTNISMLKNIMCGLQHFYFIVCLICAAGFVACSPTNIKTTGVERVELVHAPRGTGKDTTLEAQSSWPRWTLLIPNAYLRKASGLDAQHPADQWLRLRGMYVRGTDGTKPEHFRTGYQILDKEVDDAGLPLTNFSIAIANKTSIIHENGPCVPVNARRIRKHPEMFKDDGCTIDDRTKLCRYLQQIDNWSVSFSIDRSLEGGAQSYCPVFINFLEQLTVSRDPIK